jgi:hypothetical protein
MAHAVRNRWLLVTAGGFVFFIAMPDGSIVGVALPDIGRTLHAEPGVTQWTMLGYLLALISLIVPTGRWLRPPPHDPGCGRSSLHSGRHRLSTTGDRDQSPHTSAKGTFDAVQDIGFEQAQGRRDKASAPWV